ncbi:hypothetical protein B0H13DRAFT_2071239 [Mycena leptocephala]|nr:hypothetical protein B0H13DRAFT_2071239 [Mycena leptocephala]
MTNPPAFALRHNNLLATWLTGVNSRALPHGAVIVAVNDGTTNITTTIAVGGGTQFRVRFKNEGTPATGVVGVYIPDPEDALIRVAISHLNAVDPVSQSKVLKPADGWFAAEPGQWIKVNYLANEDGNLDVVDLEHTPLVAFTFNFVEPPKKKKKEEADAKVPVAGPSKSNAKDTDLDNKIDEAIIREAKMRVLDKFSK